MAAEGPANGARWQGEELRGKPSRRICLHLIERLTLISQGKVKELAEEFDQGEGV